ncbi:hypothetical protein RF11_09250 [Thelohanellus kitauei]|uniref:Tc1-like transposase DDE domain-containing protein n=1 Tax=Thelohanellus kitauei TaxID=669202 RepID=A0A0C2MCI8_THEKT|nr:hypothetical protein RF11_09250 [Thelohanellus kitauei]
MLIYPQFIGYGKNIRYQEKPPEHQRSGIVQIIKQQSREYFIKFIQERRHIPSTIQERHDYVIKYLDYSASNIFILFIDETGFDVSIRGNYGRATGGDKTEKIKKIKFKNITVCSAISRTSIMFYKVSERTFNNDLYINFLPNVMNILNDKQLKNVVFIIDNVPFHKGASIKSLITAWGNEVFIYHLTALS